MSLALILAFSGQSAHAAPPTETLTMETLAEAWLITPQEEALFPELKKKIAEEFSNWQKANPKSTGELPSQYFFARFMTSPVMKAMSEPAMLGAKPGQPSLSMDMKVNYDSKTYPLQSWGRALNLALAAVYQDSCNVTKDCDVTVEQLGVSAPTVPQP